MPKKDHTTAACASEPSPPSEKPSAPVAASKNDVKPAAPKKENKSKFNFSKVTTEAELILGLGYCL